MTGYRVTCLEVNKPSRFAGPLAKGLVSVTVCFLQACPARADFSVTYHVNSATLVLFNQPQPSPFAGIEARICVKGNRVRFEASDHVGRSHVWIADRATHQVWRLLDSQRYSVEPGGWSCDDLPSQVALQLAGVLSQAGVDSLSISGGEPGSWQSQSTRSTQWAFRAHVFGLPRPVWIFATVHFPSQEQACFGPESSELYCGTRPSEGTWRKEFERHLAVAPDGCRTLAKTISLPLALDFKTDLGVGTATLLLEAQDSSNQVLDAGLFRIPEGYSPVQVAE